MSHAAVKVLKILGKVALWTVFFSWQGWYNTAPQEESTTLICRIRA